MQREISINVNIGYIGDIFVEKISRKNIGSRIRDVNVEEQENRSKIFFLSLMFFQTV